MTERAGISRDDFLGGALKLYQPEEGYRIATDTVFLAASIKLQKNQKILDMGAGSGGILSCLAARMGKAVSDNILHGIELQEELLRLARDNADKNIHGQAIGYFFGDISCPPPDCAPNSYHHVVTNPPYYKKNGATASPCQSKAFAHMDSDITLKNWVHYCLRMIKPLGYLTLVHRADRMDDIVAALHGKAGDIIIFPLWSIEGKDASRVIIRARKGGKGILTLKSGLVVHKSDGTFTPLAEDILRRSAGLDITN